MPHIIGHHKWNEICCECETETKTQIKAGCGCLVYICDSCSRNEVRHKKCFKCCGGITAEEDKRLAQEYEDNLYYDQYDYDYSYDDYSYDTYEDISRGINDPLLDDDPLLDVFDEYESVL
jgi:hypothetical protein